MISTTRTDSISSHYDWDPCMAFAFICIFSLCIGWLLDTIAMSDALFDALPRIPLDPVPFPEFCGRSIAHSPSHPLRGLISDSIPLSYHNRTKPRKDMDTDELDMNMRKTSWHELLCLMYGIVCHGLYVTRLKNSWRFMYLASKMCIINLSSM